MNSCTNICSILSSTMSMCSDICALVVTFYYCGHHNLFVTHMNWACRWRSWKHILLEQSWIHAMMLARCQTVQHHLLLKELHRTQQELYFCQRYRKVSFFIPDTIFGNSRLDSIVHNIMDSVSRMDQLDQLKKNWIESQAQSFNSVKLGGIKLISSLRSETIRLCP